MNAIRKWNIVDSCIYCCENVIRKICLFMSDQLDDQVDTETMIEVETQHLREENEALKDRELPLYMMQKGEMYICPKCHEPLCEDDKYCCNCGHRVMKKHVFAVTGQSGGEN